MSLEIDKCSEDLYSGLIVGDFAETIQTMNTHGLKISSVADYAYQRTLLGPYHKASWTGARTSDWFCYINDEYYLAHAHPDNPLTLEFAYAMAATNSNDFEMSLTKEFIGKAIKIPSRNFEIPVESFDKHPVAKFLFGEHTEVYGSWLKDIGIPCLPFMFPSKSLLRAYPQSFMRPLILRCTDNWSGIITADCDMHVDYGTRASTNQWMGEVSAEEAFTSEKLGAFIQIFNLEDKGYTASELDSALKLQGLGKVTNSVLRVLRNQSSIPGNYNTTF